MYLRVHADLKILKKDRKRKIKLLIIQVKNLVKIY